MNTDKHPSTKKIEHPKQLLISQNVPLSDKNWFQTGGPARYFCEPKSISEFQQAIEFAKASCLKIFVLGEGANILISDKGFDGLVIRPRLLEIKRENSESKSVLVTVGAGVKTSDLIDYCLNHNLTGLEEFSGIPGTAGGSTYINIHYFEFLLSQFLVHAEVIDRKTGHSSVVNNEWFRFGYDQSALNSGTHYLASATFKLKLATALETAYARGRHYEIIRHRNSRYPTSHTCGSFFRNFSKEEVGTSNPIHVAFYLDKIGAKGTLSIGKAKISHKHANMIVNTGGATTSDIVELALKVQSIVKKQFGIIPKPECVLIGFEKNPLL